jgi:biopolymer transport protein ExbB
MPASLPAPFLAATSFWSEYWQSAIDLWNAGGWAMWPLAVTAFICYAKCGDVWFELWIRNFRINRYFGGRKVISKLSGDHAASAAVFDAAKNYINFHGVELDNDHDYTQVEHAFREVVTDEIPPLDRDLKFIQVTVAAAPLWGLLGTVTGMLTTFMGLAKGGGGEKTMNVIAGGISEALITTETGLVIALPGYFIHYILTAKRGKFEGFLEHLQNACCQRVLKLEKHQPLDD